MKLKSSFVRSILLATIAIISMSSAVAHPVRVSADALNCSSTISGSSQQGAICLPSDPTGVSSSIPNQSVKGVLLQVIQIILGFAMVIAIFFVVIGGYRYIFDAGNGEQAEKGKKTVMNALIGIVVIILSYTIVTIVTRSVTSNTGTASNAASNIGAAAAGVATPAAPSSTIPAPTTPATTATPSTTLPPVPSDCSTNVNCAP